MGRLSVSRRCHGLLKYCRGVLRREVSPSAVNVGQVAQIRLKLRLLKQEDGSFTFREMLKGVYILHDGASTVRSCGDAWMDWG